MYQTWEFIIHCLFRSHKIQKTHIYTPRLKVYFITQMAGRCCQRNPSNSYQKSDNSLTYDQTDVATVSKFWNTSCTLKARNNKRKQILEIYIYLQISVAGGRRATPPSFSLEYFLYTTFNLFSGAVECEVTRIFAQSLNHHKKVSRCPWT